MANALELPPITTGLLATVEEAALGFGVTRAQMTEAAARAAAALARKLLENQVAGATVVGLIGNGVKGCVALHTLRILHGFGADCSAVLVGGEQEMRAETLAAAETVEALRITLLQPRSPLVRGALADADLVIDGLVGVGLLGAPQEPLASLVRLCNEVRATALSLECPSGLAPDSGEPGAPTLRAKTTLALGLPVTGLFAPLAWQYTGELWLCDIGYPPAALDEADLDGDDLFTANELVRLR
jgi:hydroxyethylthiazole kinase-like uncharacterized protein yjeF